MEEIEPDTQLMCGDLAGILQDGHIVEQSICQIDGDSQVSEDFQEIEHAEEKSKPSVKDPPSLELKELPAHLEYAFLDVECRLPVIISSSLAAEEKEKLLEVMRLHKRAIAWKIMDIKGINPSFCTHKILGGG